jgi:CBS domain-containing protein
MVIDEFGKVVGVLSQTDIVKFIVKNKSKFEDSLKKTIKEISMGTGNVVSINGTHKSISSLCGIADSIVLDAMEIMSEHAVSSIAVVDTTGTLLGNISMADIRYVIKNGRFNRLWLPCLQFISSALSAKGLENHGRVSYLSNISLYRIPTRFSTYIQALPYFIVLKK